MPDSTERNAQWIARWKEGITPWHRDDVHPTLEANIQAHWRRVFVPLCGATIDLDWLAARGVEVAGADLSPLAAQKVFERLGLEPERQSRGSFEVWSSGGVTLFVGDLFEATSDVFGTFDAVWDRGSLVAFDPEDRDAYIASLRRIAPGADLLLEVFDYADHVMEGPPHAVSDNYIRATFGEVELIEEAPVGPEFGDREVDDFFVRRAYRAKL